ncbi:hypothetical protein ACFFYR_14020 [Paraburkholderia dipogonis]
MEESIKKALCICRQHHVHNQHRLAEGLSDERKHADPIRGQVAR